MKSHPLIPLALLFVACCLSTSALAQSGPKPSRPAASVAAPVTLYNLQKSDLTDRDRSWWKNIRAEHMSAMSSSAKEARRQALLNIIYFANYHRDEIEFKAATMTLYEIYRFDLDESMRVLALAALHAIGQDASMRNLAQHVQWEQSPRVRALTRAAVAGYYANKDK